METIPTAEKHIQATATNSPAPRYPVVEGSKVTAELNSPNTQRALRATDDLATLSTELEGWESGDSRTSSVVEKTAGSGHAKIFDWLINERFPDYLPYAATHLAALQGGVPVYKVFLAKWPHFREWETITHLGNAMGNAIVLNDPVLVEWLIVDQGLDPNSARWMAQREISATTFNELVQDEVIQVLVKHGYQLPKGVKARPAPKAVAKCIVQ
jgi:hypothetical protein